MGKLQSTLGYHFDQVTQTELVAEIPAHTEVDHVPIEVPTRNNRSMPLCVITVAPQLSKDDTLPATCSLHQSRPAMSN